MGFFDSYPSFYSSSRIGSAPERLNGRHRVLIEKNRHLIEGRSVLDIGSHDGRWTVAALKSGAARVIGIEARQDLVERAKALCGSAMPESERYSFVVGDAFAVLAAGAVKCDTALVFGFFYHIVRHCDLIALLSKCGATTIILDSVVVPSSDSPIVWLRAEDSECEGNAIGDGELPLVGIPSRAAIRLIATRYGYEIEELSWAEFAESPAGVKDYVYGARAAFILSKVSCLQEKPLAHGRDAITSGAG